MVGPLRKKKAVAYVCTPRLAGDMRPACYEAVGLPLVILGIV